MKKIVILVAVTLCLLLSACSNNSKLTKEWICDEIHTGYPDEITIFEDGSGIADKAGFDWKTENGKLYLTFHSKYSAQTYDLSLENDKMYLDGYSYHIRADGEEAPKIKYKFETVQD